MTAQPHSMRAIIGALAGPIVWAGHFFFLYLMEAFACTSQGASASAVRGTGIAATAAALGVLALLSLRSARVSHEPEAVRPESTFAFAGALTLLSMVAIVWTSAPLFLLPACVPAYHAMPGG
jgi:hypothetical protein